MGNVRERAPGFGVCDPRWPSVWTPGKVSEYLPPVRVKLPDGRVVVASVSRAGSSWGDRGKFARVFLPGGGSIEAAWQTLADVLNNDGTLIY